MLPSAEAAKLYQTNYVRNSRVIGLLWAIFTILFGIVNVTIFSQPYWIGDGVDTPQAGYFGLFHYCIGDGISRELACQGSFTEFAAIPSSAFKAASFFIGMSMMLVVTCIGCFSLFFLLSTSTVYKICGWMQALSGKCLSKWGAGAGGSATLRIVYCYFIHKMYRRGCIFECSYSKFTKQYYYFLNQKWCGAVWCPWYDEFVNP